MLHHHGDMGQPRESKNGNAVPVTRLGPYQHTSHTFYDALLSLLNSTGNNTETNYTKLKYDNRKYD